MTKELVSGTREILDAPFSHGNWYKKILTWALLAIVGLPIYLLGYCLTALPVLVGGALLSIQTFLFLQDGRWYSLSVLDVATRTVDDQLSTELNEPMLSSCNEARKVSSRPPSEKYRLAQPCPGLEGWQKWLARPHSWFGLHMVLTPLLYLASVPILFFVGGLFVWHFFSRLRKIWQTTPDEPPLAQFHYQ